MRRGVGLVPPAYKVPATAYDTLDWADLTCMRGTRPVALLGLIAALVDRLLFGEAKLRCQVSQRLSNQVSSSSTPGCSDAIRSLMAKADWASEWRNLRRSPRQEASSLRAHCRGTGREQQRAGGSTDMRGG